MPFNGQDLIVKNRGLWELKLKNGCLSFPWFFGSVKWIFKNYQRRTYWKKKRILWKDSDVFPSPMALFTTKTNALPLCLIHGSFFWGSKKQRLLRDEGGIMGFRDNMGHVKLYTATTGTPFRVVFILVKLSGLTWNSSPRCWETGMFFTPHVVLHHVSGV